MTLLYLGWGYLKNFKEKALRFSSLQGLEKHLVQFNITYFFSNAATVSFTAAELVVGVKLKALLNFEESK